MERPYKFIWRALHSFVAARAMQAAQLIRYYDQSRLPYRHTLLPSWVVG